MGLQTLNGKGHEAAHLPHSPTVHASITPFKHYGWVCPRRPCLFVLQASLS